MLKISLLFHSRGFLYKLLPPNNSYCDKHTKTDYEIIWPNEVQPLLYHYT
jgi:hypothetical protein